MGGSSARAAGERVSSTVAVASRSTARRRQVAEPGANPDGNWQLIPGHFTKGIAGFLAGEGCHVPNMLSMSHLSEVQHDSSSSVGTWARPGEQRADCLRLRRQRSHDLHLRQQLRHYGERAVCVAADGGAQAVGDFSLHGESEGFHTG